MRISDWSSDVCSSDLGGWDMPLNYGSQIEEHHQVRRDAGMFDVSHMTVVDLHGAKVREFLRRLVANSVDKLKKPGKALYTCMPDERSDARRVGKACARQCRLRWTRYH